MAIKDQLNKLKDNWLIILVVTALLIFMNIDGVQNLSYSSKSLGSGMYNDVSYESVGINGARTLVPSQGTSFAPDVIERKITKTASLTTEVKNSEFESAQQNLKNILSSSGSFIINENVNVYGSEKKEYHQGWYDIKVDTSKYDALIPQLKSIGKVLTFNENTNDVTGQYTNTQINLDVEKSRLLRYQDMYAQATIVQDKITLNDRIFDQERTIKYLEDSIKNIDERIDYTTIRFSLIEKKAGYADVVLVKFSSLIKNLVDSFNALLVFLFAIAPWAVLIAIVVFIWKFIKRK